MKCSWKRFTLIAVLVIGVSAFCALILGCGGVIRTLVSSPNAIPALLELSPSYAVGSSSAQTVVITGTNFTSSSAVTFNGAMRSSTLLSPQQLSISLGQTDLAQPGNYTIAVTNPPPGGGTSPSATFSVWQPIIEPSTGLSFAVPPFGPADQIDVDTSTPGPILITFSLQEGAGVFVPEFSLRVYDNPSGLSLYQWFGQNIDMNGILVADNTVQQETLSDGSTGLVLSGPIPYGYSPDGGGPSMDNAYKLCNSGQVIGIRQSQVSDLMSYGYPTAQALSQLEVEILGTVHF